MLGYIVASYKNFLGLWGVFILLWGWACTLWPQTIGTITNRSYPTGASNAVVPLTLTGFRAQKVIRTTAANITSGNSQSYEGPGTRILQGLKPDVVMIQEFNVGNKTTAEFRSWVDTTFGTDFSYFRESSGAIPNGVISRWPIRQSGSWDISGTRKMLEVARRQGLITSSWQTGPNGERDRLYHDWNYLAVIENPTKEDNADADTEAEDDDDFF